MPGCIPSHRPDAGCPMLFLNVIYSTVNVILNARKSTFYEIMIKIFKIFSGWIPSNLPAAAMQPTVWTLSKPSLPIGNF
jgi:hypothetical protein